MAGDSRQPMSFHTNVGDNIELENGGLTARKRNTDYRYHSTVFSSRPLEPGEIFTVRVEIEGRSRVSLSIVPTANIYIGLLFSCFKNIGL